MATQAPEINLQEVTTEHNDDGTITLRIVVAPEEVQQARRATLKKLSRELRVPGFRPGHVPPAMVRRQVGEAAINQRLSEDLTPRAYSAALRQTGIDPLERAQVEDVDGANWADDDPLRLTVKVTARPEIQLGECEGLSAEQPSSAVSSEDIEQFLEQVRQDRARLIPVTERGAQWGDVINARLQVFINDAPHNEEPVQLRPFILGESQLVPALDPHLEGAQTDEERRFSLTYPEDYHDTELAGQNAEFVVWVDAVRQRELPDIDESFLAEIGAASREELEERAREHLRLTKERQGREHLRRQLVETLLESSHFTMPAALVDRRAHARLHNLEHELEGRDLTLEQYLNETGRTREELDQQLREATERDLKRELVLDELARRQHLEVTPEEVQQYLSDLAQATQQPFDKVVKEVDLIAVQANLLQRKAIDWLVEHAAITEADAGSGETGSGEAGSQPGEEAAAIPE